MSNLKCHPIRKVTAGVCFEVGLLRRVTCLVVTGEFYILVTVHLGIISINNQLDAQFLLYIFIWILYMFSATLCSSSGESIISLQHLVYVSLCRWPSGMQVGKELQFLPHLHTGRSPTQTDIYQMLYWYDLLSWWWAQSLLETCRESN